MLEVNLFGTKILLPKDAGASMPAGGEAGLNSGRPASGADATTSERQARGNGASRPGADSSSPTPPKDGTFDGVPEEIKLEDDDL